MKLRQAFLPLLLSMLLLGAQQMAWLHLLSHVGGGKTTTSQAKQLPADKVCDQCLAFAQVASALDRAPFAFVSDPLAVDIVLSSRPHAASVQPFIAFQPRAPPRLL